MAGGALMISRHIKLFSYWTQEFEAFGFNDVLFTDNEKDGLNSLIREFKPSIVLIGCGFYRRSTPYMMLELLEYFPKLNIAAINIHEFPDDLAMYFILNGVNSYVNQKDGMEEFHRGLKLIRDGKKYISPAVEERISIRDEKPMPAKILTPRLKEVICLIHDGYKDDEIADVLHISSSTIDNHKTEIFRSLNVRNIRELCIVAEELGIAKKNENIFYPKNFTVNPKPKKVRKTSVRADFSDWSFSKAKTPLKAIDITASMPSEAIRRKK